MRSDWKLAFAATLAAFGLSLLAGARRPVVQHGDAAALSRPALSRPGSRPEEARPGGGAAHPAQIPPAGWWQIAQRVARQFSDHRLMTEAAGITFYALLALFPALAAFVSLYGLFADPATIATQVDALAGLLPGGGVEIITGQVRALASSSNQALGVGLLLGLATSLWSANQGMKAIFDALNVVYDERERRGYVRRTLVSLVFTMGSLAFAAVCMAAIVAVPVALAMIDPGPAITWALRLLRWPLLLGVMSVFLAFVYRFGPSREQARWRWVSWGSVLAVLVWMAGSAGFSWYVANFGGYNKTYGSLGAAVGFMTWIWISAIVVLLGAEVNAELEHQTARDTTTGPDQPLGTRGATKADTLPG
ncbi:Ribonuclease BN [Rhodovastum atsumiense]|uniref:YihY/virulence factor BrkB family protein n=1 Tax=Rhodovastum atsumiense TaxID=504468 RepID=A0A5M6IMU1_9PROT|nr:YihY/virulence factor BrkB family protein [Rhodovastum atsumiense]KAA5609179.1 YihY/virulence factor BrkB family protein [Rhodovastum atsumiense]CAH2602826.1 Ribonuclease BN [Rhodovastum atsumiense]